MLTVVLLLLPAVFSLSVFRLYQLPRDLRARAVRLNPRNKSLATLGFGIIYAVLAGDTFFVLFTAALPFIRSWRRSRAQAAGAAAK